MSWEVRGKHGRRYYYFAYRDSEGKIRKKYVGAMASEETALKVGMIESCLRSIRHYQREPQNEVLDVAHRLVDQIDHACDSLLSAHLLMNGFHRLNYGSWRKRRAKEKATDLLG